MLDKPHSCAVGHGQRGAVDPVEVMRFRRRVGGQRSVVMLRAVARESSWRERDGPNF
jgi:hypothetical protein